MITNSSKMSNRKFFRTFSVTYGADSMESANAFKTFGLVWLWGVLEAHWSGALLTAIDVVREWTRSMRWAGVAPNVYHLDDEYHRGVK